MKIAYLAKGRPDLEAMIPADSDHVIVAAGPDGQYSAEDLDRIADVDAFVVSMEPVHEQILAAAKNLKIVQRMGAGYETLDLEAAARRGIPCCNIEGVNKEAVAEHCMTLILALSKCLFEAESLTRQCQWAAIYPPGQQYMPWSWQRAYQSGYSPCTPPRSKMWWKRWCSP